MKNRLLKVLLLIFLIGITRIQETNSYYLDTIILSDNTISTGCWEDDEPGLGDVVINEVYYDVRNDDSKGTENKNEWIELYNSLDYSVSLKNWTITDGQGNIKTVHLEVSIPAKGFAVLSHDHSTWSLYWPLPAETVTIQLGGSLAWLNNSGDALTLKDSNGNEIDLVSWKNFIDGWSLNAKDTNSPDDWEVSSEPNPGA
jgi:ABC-type tungstate transport system permease subunit